MSDDPRQAFLDEIISSPEDDTPRLIFADWLDEAGDPRGQFIRLQCQLAKTDLLDPHFLDASHRCDQLLQEYGEAWTGQLKQDVRNPGLACPASGIARDFVRSGQNRC